MRNDRRRAERWILTSAAAWTTALAVVTLYPYLMWLTSSGYEALEAADALGSAAALNEVAAFVRLYGIALLLVGIATAVLAWRMPYAHRRGIVWWLALCTLGALLTRDIVGMLLFGVCLIVYLSRSRALRLMSQNTPELTLKGAP